MKIARFGFFANLIISFLYLYLLYFESKRPGLVLDGLLVGMFAFTSGLWFATWQVNR